MSADGGTELVEFTAELRSPIAPDDQGIPKVVEPVLERTGHSSSAERAEALCEGEATEPIDEDQPVLSGEFKEVSCDV